MANNNNPIGFVPYGRLLRANEYVVSAACYPGDLVILNASGKVSPAAAGNSVIGACIGYASAADGTVLVADHPDQLFVAVASSVGLDSQTDIGNLADIVATAANTTYKISRQAVDTTTLYTSISATVQILGLEPRSGEDGFSTSSVGAKAIVRINEHQLAQSQSSGV